MNDIITRLSNIEDAASSIVEEANVQKKDIQAEVDSLREEWEQNLEQETQDRILSLQKEMEAATRKKLDDLRMASEKNLALLQASYEENHTRIVQELLEKITGVTP